ncbi:intraflagellar transport protein 46 homolog isoform X1 [Nelusetta ayraudi]|uniref:intraflagellar transport protein 46 homolog isoform X1 n=1 Tax=Nelusetta ayraudi TaxID=303726 RepID=UPI003F70E1EC
MERPDRLRTGRQLLANQPYDESLEADDVDEVAGAYGQRQLDSRKRQRGLVSANSGSFDYDEEPKSQTGSVTAGRQRAASPDEEDEDEEEDSDEEDSDDSEPSRAPEGAYDPADYANLPVNTKIKELFQYITRYTPQSIELEHSLKPFIPEYIPAVGDIDAFLKVPRPDGKPDDLGLLMLDEPSVKQSDPTVMSLWLSEDSKQHGTPEIKKVTSVPCPQSNPRPVDSWVDSISALHRSKPPASVQYSRPMPSIDSLMQEWPAELEELLQRHPPPTAALACSTAQYADLACALLDIPVNCSRIQSLHLLFSLYLEFRGLQHFTHTG